jgi:peptidyl-tRNA hydrolase, PTH1 family
MFLIFGLGNPGEQYKNNRHNIGYLFLDYFIEKNCLNNFKKKGNFLYSNNNIKNNPVALIKPTTFMNASVFAVTQAMNFFKAITNNIIVIYDDAALPFGKIRIKDKGTHGGHNGLKSIQNELGDSNYKKIRIGIGAPEHPSAMISHVLGNFTKDDLFLLKDKVFPNIEDAIYLFIFDKLTDAMNKYNGIDIS